MSAMEMLSQGTLTVPDAERFSGMGRTWLYDAMGKGDLAFTRAGARRLIPKVALINLLASRLNVGNQNEPNIEGK